MAYDALDISKYIVSYCAKKDKPVSNLKLQKLLYYTWIEYFKKTNTDLFSDRIFAWQLGPVVPKSYYEFCSYAGIPITREYEVKIKDFDKTIINPIIDEYSKIPASALVSRSHKKGNPWDLVYRNGIGNRKEIPFTLIKHKECAVK